MPSDRGGRRQGSIDVSDSRCSRFSRNETRCRGNSSSEPRSQRSAEVQEMRTPSRAALALAMGVFTAGGITAVSATTADAAAPSHAKVARTVHNVTVTLPGTGVRLTTGVDDAGQVTSTSAGDDDGDEVGVADGDVALGADDDAAEPVEAGDDQGEDNQGQDAGGDQGEDAGGDNQGDDTAGDDQGDNAGDDQGQDAGDDQGQDAGDDQGDDAGD